MRRLRLTLTGLSTVAAFAATAGTAGANGILQTTDGRPYTGPLFFTLMGNAVNATPSGSVTCNESALTSEVTDAGSLDTPMTATVSMFEVTNSGSQACPDTVPVVDHVDNVPLDMPYATRADWLSDNVAGLANGTFTLSGARIMGVFTGGVTCDYVANSNGTGTSTRELPAAVYNPDNTPSGQLEIRFEGAPVTVVGGGCPDGTFTAGYSVTGQSGAQLELRGAAPPVPNETANARVVEGEVLVKRPGESAFTRLEDPTTVPLGSQIDATRGRVELVTASDSSGGTRSGEFYGGVFEIGQASTKGKGRADGGLTTVLDLVSRVGCGSRAAGKKGNGLWGEGDGGHAIEGRRGSGTTTRESVWFVGNTCKDTTAAKVKEGKVSFRDFVLDETVKLRKGDSYVAGRSGYNKKKKK